MFCFCSSNMNLQRVKQQQSIWCEFLIFPGICHLLLQSQSCHSQSDSGTSHKISHLLLCSKKSIHQREVLSDQTARRKRKGKLLIAIYKEMTENDGPWIPLLLVLPVLSRRCLNSSSGMISPFLRTPESGSSIREKSREAGGIRKWSWNEAGCQAPGVTMPCGQQLIPVPGEVRQV